LDGVVLTPLKTIYNPKGFIYHAMKKSDDEFHGFGEAYFSTIEKDCIKGWKKHTKMTLNLIVINGEIEFVIFCEKTNFFFSAKLSRKNYQRLTIRPGLWVAFKGLSKDNVLLNLASTEHNPHEEESNALENIGYKW
jgi:dTDP-4-dehydrorhamnose 3,5-epimerase